MFQNIDLFVRKKTQIKFTNAQAGHSATFKMRCGYPLRPAVWRGGRQHPST